ncbi:hypothetical protein [Psychrobacter sp. AOP3-A1-26]|uniref:hypothetical protein n=1 Tax=Psychrobacter sp. AOP3-A1-26 TaxID=3457700 RepID=UPI004036326D
MRQNLGILAKQYYATSAIIITDAGISKLGYVNIAIFRVLVGGPITVFRHNLALTKASQNLYKTWLSQKPYNHITINNANKTAPDVARAVLFFNYR